MTTTNGPPIDTSATPVPGDAAAAAPPRKRVWLFVAVIAAVLLIAGTLAVLALGGQTQRFTVAGTFNIANMSELANGLNADSGPGYGDIHPGTEVLLSDETGKTIAVGHLERDYSRAGAYTFKLTEVPAGLKFYGLTVASRGTVHFTEAQLRAGPHVSLGE